MDEQLKKKLQHLLDVWRVESNSLGINVTVIDSISGTWSASSGYADLEHSSPMHINQRCYIYSITKTFTAIIALKLIELGKLKLTDRMNVYFPNLRLPDSITISNTLDHTSGLVDYLRFKRVSDATQQHPSNPWNDDQLLTFLAENNEKLHTGRQNRNYSNLGYFLLRKVIERTTEMPFQECIDRYLTKPLGLEATFVANQLPVDGLTNGYSRRFNANSELEDVSLKYHPKWVKPGVVVSTTLETAKIFSALSSEKLISQSSVFLMTKGAGSQGNQYGYGCDIFPSKSYGLSIGHGAGGPGFTTACKHYFDLKGRAVTIAVFCNSNIDSSTLSLFDQLVGHL